MSRAAVIRPKTAVSVLLPLPLAGAYDYAVPDDLMLAPGDFVTVPLGKRTLIGVVWGEGGDFTEKTLKPVLSRLDGPKLPDPLRRFIDWVAAYHLAPQGAVLRMCFAGVIGREPPPKPGFTLGDLSGLQETAARTRVIELLQDGPPRGLADIVETASVSASVVTALAKAGHLLRVPLAAPPPPPAAIDWQKPGPTLSERQEAAAQVLKAAVAAHRYSCTLLEGVTGAGKTEVYMEAVAATMAAGRQVLILLPEIALSAQWLERFKARFGTLPAQWHSDLGAAARRRTWRGIAAGRLPVVVGARSTLFLPFPDLGLIVVDEEHDSSFKQEEGVIYHARDMAVVRASLSGFPIVLASATPSLETIANVEAGRYQHVLLPERHGRAQMPLVQMIDLRADPPLANSWLSPRLIESVRAVLARGEQAMLFLNRRGYAPLTLCGACGHRLQCPNCSAWLVQHRSDNRLHCHHCGHRVEMPKTCPSCEAEDRLKACGPGVERLEEEARRLFPEARIAVMASDSLSGPAAAAALVRAMQAREIDLLIGTQLVAKGHHFSDLTLVGVVDADLSLGGGDLRAGERTLQLLVQVAGRAGRADKPGQVLLQSYMPEHPVLQALLRGDVKSFLAAELRERTQAAMPPFGRLAALIISGSDHDLVADAARRLIRTAPIDGKTAQVFGPVPAPLAKLRGRHRYRLLVKTAREANMQALLRRWIGDLRLKGDTKLQIDIDPQSFM